MKNGKQSPKSQILRGPEVDKEYGVSKTARYELIKQGVFPKPIKLGPRSVGWLRSELDAWVEARVAERDETAA